MMSSEDPGLPVDVAVDYGPPKGEGLQLLPGVGQLPKILRGERCHLKALLRLAAHESLLREAQHALPQDPHAGPVSLTEVGVAEALSWPEPPGQNLGTQR